ncbi:MAG TPA: ATP synthase F1 subunit gamma [Polyangia bacterium]|jgi:F-type H+-transporting ATPase subunit gamma|nr:ATP synthase F1 subunit gamma [Polyangia bacterium]
MPSLKAIRVRIASVKSTQKITRAMKLVAAARLRRAQDAIVGARPYANALLEAVREVAGRAGTESHPLLDPRPQERVALIPISSDRGLAGGFNANIFRAVGRFAAEKKEPMKEISLEIVGKKGRDYFRRRALPIKHEFGGASGDTAQDRARQLALTAVQIFRDGQVDAVYLVYNEFKSAIAQKVQVEQLLPVVPPAVEAPAGHGERSDSTGGKIDFLYEPDKQQLLDALLPLYVESQIYRALLESIASEFGARMTAMESATKNAKEAIARYTLQYNRARQAAITKELMEIVGGAEALKG